MKLVNIAKSSSIFSALNGKNTDRVMSQNESVKVMNRAKQQNSTVVVIVMVARNEGGII